MVSISIRWVVAFYASSFIDWVRESPQVLGIGFSANNEEGTCQVQGEQLFEVHITAVYDKESAGLRQ